MVDCSFELILNLFYVLKIYGVQPKRKQDPFETNRFLVYYYKMDSTWEVPQSGL